MKAVAISLDMEYAIVEPEKGERLLIVAIDRLEPLQDVLGKLKVLATLSGKSSGASCWETRKVQSNLALTF